MTRNQVASDDLKPHFQCFISDCQITNGSETKESFEPPNTVEGITGLNNSLVTKGLIRNTDMDNNETDSTTLSNTASLEHLIPVESVHKQNADPSAVKTNGDSEYVSLNLHIWKKRTKSDGALYKKRKPNCYFGRKNTADKRTARSRSTEVCRRPIQDVAGISESPVFFSTIGEWTIVDLNRQVFEKEDASRISYLRKKGTSYKEVEPENVCCIL